MPDLSESTDAPANTSTGYSIGVGQTAYGWLSYNGDHDWYRIDLQAGQTYTVVLTGTGTGNLVDPYLRIYNSSGTSVAYQNDDGLPNHNSIVTFTVTGSDTYYIDAGAWNDSGSGQYGISLIAGSRADLGADLGAGVIDSDYQWIGGSVSVGFRLTDDGQEANFSNFTAQQRAATLQVLSNYSDVMALNINVVNSGGYTDNAQILLSNYNYSDGSGGYSSYPYNQSASSQAGDIHVNLAGGSSTSSLPIGSYSYFVILHEMGHSMGLSHPGLYNAGVGQTITYNNNAQFVQDTQQYSVMSYFDESNSGASFSGYPQTLMLYDIYALQQIYGANTTTRTGDSVYGFNSNVSGVYDFSTNTSPALCIWDAGGTDTLDVSGFAQNQLINLYEGGFSNVGGRASNVSIAYGALIENAIGGSGNDTIIGNTLGNQISGGLGNDTLIGGLGIDLLYGGPGSDTAVVEGATSNWNIVRFGDVVELFSTVTNEHDFHESIEIFDFTDTDLVLTTLADNDPFAYLATYPDLLNAFGANADEAIVHYFYNGYYEGRLLDGFDEWSYLASYSDLINAFGANGSFATMHYVYNGYSEGRALDLFDEWSYLASNTDLIGLLGANGALATQQYVDAGYSEGRAIDTFDELQYIASYGDLIQAFGANGLFGEMHYVNYGFDEGRVADFDAAQYLANYADLQAAFGSDLEAATLHFITNGYYEGRTDEVIV